MSLCMFALDSMFSLSLNNEISRCQVTAVFAQRFSYESNGTMRALTFFPKSQRYSPELVYVACMHLHCLTNILRLKRCLMLTQMCIFLQCEKCL